MGVRSHKQEAKYSPYESAAAFEFATFTIGANVATVRNVGIVLKNANGEAIGFPVAFRAWLSDAATGIGITATVPDGGAAAGTNGTFLLESVTDKMFECLSDASGRLDMNITMSAGHDYYLVVVNPLGFLTVSGKISF